MKLSGSMKDFLKVNKLISIIIIFVIGWLINYIIRFMIKRRGNEFSIYMLLGLKSSSLYLMFFIENLLLCIISLVMGILFGTLLFMILSILIMKIFEVDYQLIFYFSFKALGLTVAYAAGMMLLSLLFNSRKMRKMSIYELMCSEKKNELQVVDKKSNGNITWFGVFCSTGIFGLTFMHYITTVKPELATFKNLFVSILSIVISIYGCYISLSPAVVRLFLNGNRKYKGNRMIIFRELAAKVNLMRFTMGNIAVLITLTFLAVQTGMLLKGFLDELFISRAPFDVMVTDTNEENDFGEIINYLESKEGIREKHKYNIYDVGTADVGGFFKREVMESDWGTYMKYSDYVMLRKMLGYSKTVEIEGGLRADNCTAVIIVSFTMFYMGLIFTCVIAAIMAVQQLGDLGKSRYHYQRLSQFGMSEHRIDRLILHKMLIYFGIPLLLSIPVSISIFNSIGHIFNSYVNKQMMFDYMIGSLIGFGIIYFLYFALTYLSFIKGVRKTGISY